MFQKLPTEVLEAIVDQLPSKKDRRALWGVSRRFTGLLTTRVFETLTIRAKEHALTQLDARPYHSLDVTSALGCLKLIKHLHLRAPFHEKLDAARCPHHELCGGYYPDCFTHPDASRARLPKLTPLLLQLRENGLLGFNWDLGMCVPNHILGPEGYLTKKQTAIESLSLITVSFDFWHLRPIPPETVILSEFPKLRKLSWKGLHSTEDLDALRGFFKRNYRVLEDLELDFISWEHVMIDGELASEGMFDVPIPSFTKEILPHRTNGVCAVFRSLTRLALSAFDFEETTRGITRAFNIGNLQSLKLNDCGGVITFLSTIVNAGLVLKLKSLELIIGDELVDHGGLVESPLVSFLQSFNGLEHLHIMLNAEMPRLHHWRSCYWNAILHHGSTLKRLVYHERKLRRPEGGSGGYPTWVDNTLFEIRLEDSLAERTHSQENHFYNSALAQMQLECFAVADSHQLVLLVMSTPLTVKQNFKLLHIRRTGTDDQCDALGREPRFEDQIRDLVKHNPGSWSRHDYLRNQAETGPSVFDTALCIFQSPKFEELQVLAFGDFSHGGRYKWRHLLLCRAVTPNPEIRFRVMSPDDIEFYKRSGLLSLDFLAACPRETLLERDSWGEFP